MKSVGWMCRKSSITVVGNVATILFFVQKSVASSHHEVVKIICRVGSPSMQCTCLRDNHLGFPCKHGWLALSTGSQDPSLSQYHDLLNPSALHWFHRVFHLETLRRQYEFDRVLVFPDLDTLTDENLWPPMMQRPSGRPKNRKERKVDPKRIMTCRSCGEVGHNARICSNPSTSIMVASTRYAPRKPKEKANTVQTDKEVGNEPKDPEILVKYDGSLDDEIDEKKGISL